MVESDKMVISLKNLLRISMCTATLESQISNRIDEDLYFEIDFFLGGFLDDELHNNMFGDLNGFIRRMAIEKIDEV